MQHVRRLEWRIPSDCKVNQNDFPKQLLFINININGTDTFYIQYWAFNQIVCSLRQLQLNLIYMPTFIFFSFLAFRHFCMLLYSWLLYLTIIRQCPQIDICLRCFPNYISCIDNTISNNSYFSWSCTNVIPFTVQKYDNSSLSISYLHVNYILKNKFALQCSN